MSLNTGKIPREAQVTRPVVAKTDNETTKSAVVKDAPEFTNNRYLERIGKLEDLLAKQIERSAGLLKENKKLEADLEKMKQQRDCWRKLYRKIKPDKKVTCDRQSAMIVYGEIDTNELLDRKVDKM